MRVTDYLEELDKLADQIDISEAKRDTVIAFMETCPALCFIKSPETGKYLYANAKSRKLLGRDLVGHTDIELFSTADAKRLVANDLDVIKSGDPTITIETIDFNENKRLVFIVIKFIVVNGERCIGGIAIELPDRFKVELREGR